MLSLRMAPNDQGPLVESSCIGNLRLAARKKKGRVDRPVFVVGMGRSGTTLLGCILATHASVGFLNEPKALWHKIRDDEDIIGSYGPPGAGRLCFDAADASDPAIQRAHSMYSWYLWITRSRRLVDKYPELVFRAPFVRAIFPDARFLVAVRSPWQALESVAVWSQIHEIDQANWWGYADQKWNNSWLQGVTEMPGNEDIAAMDLANERDEYVRAAVEWVVTMRAAMDLVRGDHRAEFVLYDDLVANPREIVERILDLPELPPDPHTWQYAEAVVSPRRTSGDHPTAGARLPEPLLNAVSSTWALLTKAVRESPLFNWQRQTRSQHSQQKIGIRRFSCLPGQEDGEDPAATGKQPGSDLVGLAANNEGWLRSQLPSRVTSDRLADPASSLRF